MLKRVFLSLPFIACWLIGTSQNVIGEPPKVIPPSPNAAALQRYGDIPVSTYTGTPQVSIPIYTINAGDITVPLSISYHASGIKVGDEASRVGLGWALNAGGVITRTIMGQDDFDGNNFNYHSGNSNVPETPNDVPFDKGHTFNVQNGCNPSGFMGSPNYGPYLQETHDFMPDVYTYNLPGYTGRFILKRNKQVILGKKEKITITCLDNNANAWEIKTPDGMKYLFEEYEAYDDPNTGSQLSRKSAWYLTKIISPKGEQVTFQYQVNVNQIKPIGSFFESVNTLTYFYAAPSPCPADPASGPIPEVHRESPRGQYRNVYLDKIIFKNGECRFIYSGDREDVYNDYKLTKIQVYAKSYVSNVSIRLIKETEFGYSYFVGTADQDYSPTSGLSTQVSRRLKLVSVTEKDGSGNALPPHSFVYNSDGTDPSSLPAKTSFARDHWGYYNGKVSNTTLIPTYLPSRSNNAVAFALGIMGNNRDTDPLYPQLFVLKEIQYPTGGKTVFEYESNTFDIPNSNTNDHSFYAGYPEALEKTINKIYPGNIAGDQPSQANEPNYILDLTNMYTDPSTSSTNVNIQATFIFNTSQSSCALPSYYNKITFTLTTESGSVIAGPTDPFAWLPPNNPSFTTCNGGGQSYYGMTFSNTYTLPPGKYLWKLHIDPGAENLFSNVALNVNFLVNKALEGIQYNGQNIKNADYAGGLRIKRILNYEHNSATPIIKKYVYHYSITTGGVTSNYSYGRRMTRPVYSYFEKSGSIKTCYFDYGYGQQAVTSEGVNQHLMRESEGNYPLTGSVGGNVVGYDKVIELIGDNGELGKTEYEFENITDVLLNYSQADYFGPFGTPLIPRKPPLFATIPNAGNGNLKNSFVYEFKNNTYYKIKEINNTYTEYRSTTPLWWGIDKRPWLGAWAASSNCNITVYPYPAIVESRKLLTSSVIKTYSKSDYALNLVQTNTYTYDHSSHLQLTQTSQTLSNGDGRKIDITYSSDYADPNADAAILEMKNNKHIYSVPITKKSTLVKADGNQLIRDAEINKFQVLNGMVLPQEVALLETVQPFTPATLPGYTPASGSFPNSYSSRLKYEAFDATGNVTQVRKSDDVATAFVWDYLTGLPIAEVTNATSSQVAYTSFEADGTGNWSFTGGVTTDPTALTGKRTYSISSSVTKSISVGGNYIVSYWSKNGPQNVNSTTYKTGRSVSGWTYYEHLVSVGTGGTITVSGSGTIDELRLYPEKALMTSMTYAPLIGVTSQCDPNNKIIYYEYDEFNRLVIVRDQDKNVVKRYCYNYNGQTENCNLYYNTPQSGNFTKQCPPDHVGSTVTYTVPADIYSSSLSVPDANNKALADVQLNGQAYANSVGTCTYVPPPVTIQGYNTQNKNYNVRFTNTSTGAVYNFVLYAYTYSPVTLGTVPAGAYNVLFYLQSSPPPATCTFNVNGATYYGTGASFSNVSITAASTVSMY